MKIELEIEDLVYLVNGTEPSYKNMEHPLIKICGSYRASYGVWDWNISFLKGLTEEQLWGIYLLCKGE